MRLRFPIALVSSSLSFSTSRDTQPTILAVQKTLNQCTQRKIENEHESDNDFRRRAPNAFREYSTIQRSLNLMRRPRIILNFAMTVDGKVSTAKHTPSGFTSTFDKHRLLEIRSLGDAVMVGKGTLEIDQMSMGLPDAALRRARIKRGQNEYPIRVVISNSGDISNKLHIFSQPISPVVIYSTTRMPPINQTELRSMAELHLSPDDRLNLPEVLNDLYEAHQVRTVVCEGGPQLAKALAEIDAVDELFLTIAPILAGGAGAPGILGAAGAFLPASRIYRLESMKLEAEECYLHYVAERTSCTTPTQLS
jgi:2,5-diamino-6-(ribosylamino)-4(3H)-pyrimidinone 5'-phosphate reductase